MNAEMVFKSLLGMDELRVYPGVSGDAPPNSLAAAGYVTAMRYWPKGEETLPPVWGVRVNICYEYPMPRHQSVELCKAITRCWDWIDDIDSRESE